MVGIGLRVYSNSIIYYSIIEQKHDGSLQLLNISNLKTPKSTNFPEALSYIRSTLNDILSEYKVSSGVVRLPEQLRSIRKSSIERFYIEGVILETLASSKVGKYLGAQISELTNVGGIPKKSFKKLADGEIEFDYDFENVTWKKLKGEERESIIAAYASLKL
ncbi:hypothetical protein D3C87_32340 [compost metagenome]